MGECACRRTGRRAKLQEMPCGEHMIVVRDPDGGWRAADDDGTSSDRFTVWPGESGVELEDRESGGRLAFPSLVEALVAVCDLCDGDAAPCRAPDPE